MKKKMKKREKSGGTHESSSPPSPSFCFLSPSSHHSQPHPTSPSNPHHCTSTETTQPPFSRRNPAACRTHKAPSPKSPISDPPSPQTPSLSPRRNNLGQPPPSSPTSRFHQIGGGLGRARRRVGGRAAAAWWLGRAAAWLGRGRGEREPTGDGEGRKRADRRGGREGVMMSSFRKFEKKNIKNIFL